MVKCFVKKTFTKGRKEGRKQGRKEGREWVDTGRRRYRRKRWKEVVVGERDIVKGGKMERNRWREDNRNPWTEKETRRR